MVNANPMFTVGINMRRVAEVQATADRSILVRGLPKDMPLETMPMNDRVTKTKLLSKDLAQVEAVFPLPAQEAWTKFDGAAVLQLITADEADRLVTVKGIRDVKGRTMFFEQWFASAGEKKAAKKLTSPKPVESESEDDFADALERLQPRKTTRSPTTTADGMQK